MLTTKIRFSRLPDCNKNSDGLDVLDAVTKICTQVGLIAFISNAIYASCMPS